MGRILFSSAQNRVFSASVAGGRAASASGAIPPPAPGNPKPPSRSPLRSLLIRLPRSRLVAAECRPDATGIRRGQEPRPAAASRATGKAGQHPTPALLTWKCVFDSVEGKCECPIRWGNGTSDVFVSFIYYG